MAAPEKMDFKICVKEIGNGFIVSIEDRQGTNWEQRFCPDAAEIVVQIQAWLKRAFLQRVSAMESKEEKILKENKEKLEDIEEEELTDEEIEEKNRLLLEKGERVLEKARKDLKDRKAGWPKCPVCKIRLMAPWNKTGKCSYCQTYKKKLKEDL